MTPRTTMLRADTITAGRTASDVTCGLVDRIHSNYVSVGFVFEHEVDETRLLEGLRSALRLVPTFAGRLRVRPGGVDIVCSDAGVPVTVHDVDTTRDGAVADMANPGTVFGDTVDLESLPLEQCPLLAVRLYRLADGARAIGCTWHHTVGDLHSFMLFMRAWSASVEGVEPPQVLIVDDRDAFLDEFLPVNDSGRSAYRLLTPREVEHSGDRRTEAPDEQRRVTQIHFASQEVERIRRNFSETTGGELSSNDGLHAHLATAIRRLRGDDGINLSSIVNLRTRLGMPAGFVGNPLWPMAVFSPPSQTAAGLAHRIREGLNAFPALHLSMRTTRAFIEKSGGSWPGDFERVLGRSGSPTFRVTNWRNSGAYSISFAGRFPMFFNFLPTGISRLPASVGPLISVIESPGGGGLLVTFITSAALAEQLRDPAASLPPSRWSAT